MSVTVVYRSAADLNRAEYWYEEGPKLQIEVEKLRKVVEAARDVKLAFDKVCVNPDKESLYHYSLKDDYARAETLLFEALEDLDKEGNKKD